MSDEKIIEAKVLERQIIKSVEELSFEKEKYKNECAFLKEQFDARGEVIVKLNECFVRILDEVYPTWALDWADGKKDYTTLCNKIIKEIKRLKRRK